MTDPLCKSKQAAKRAAKAEPARKLALELLEDRATPSAGLGLALAPPAAPQDAHTMLAYVAAQPRSIRELRMLSSLWSKATDKSATPVAPQTDATPPAVAGIEFASSEWSTEFLSVLAGNAGFPAQTGPAQFDSLPWVNVDTIRVAFTEDVNVVSESLLLSGVNVANYPIANFNYDAATFTATWRLSQAIGGDKLRLRLDATGVPSFGPGPITDLAGNRLQGAWVDGVSAFPSGDGVAGIDFQFRFNVLPGDLNRDGRVDSAELLAVRESLMLRVGESQYSVFFDVDGSGQIRNRDVNGVRNQVNSELPAGNPAIQTRIRLDAGQATGIGGRGRTQQAVQSVEIRGTLTNLLSGSRRRSKDRVAAATAEMTAALDALFASTVH